MTFLRLFLFVFVTGCTHMAIHSASGTPSNIKAIKTRSVFWGWLGSRTLSNREDLCPENELLSLDIQMTPLDVLLTTISGGLYVQQTATIVCGTPGPSKGGVRLLR